MRIELDIQKRCLHPFAVLVFPVFDVSVVFVQHPVRGWEVPGGKVEPRESAEEAVCREGYEEAGVILEHLVWVAEYDTSDGNHKWVYFADVVDIGARPVTSEITDVMVPRPLWSPTEATQRRDVSFIMKDDVYRAVWPILLRKIAEAGN